jgi:3alpha(or 20beta)-hydroxysteroid dehydrogenase
MTKAAAVDLARFGIRVNSIHPGPIETGMLAGFTAAQRAQRISMVPLEREGTVDEVAELVSFLLSERSSYITGAEIAIDGGLTL